MRKVSLEARFFKKNEVVDEWDWFLEQLGIPEDKRNEIDMIEFEIMTSDISATDIDGNEVKI